MMTFTEDYRKEVVTIFFAQKDVIIWTTVTLFLLSIMIAFVWPKTFAAYGTILFKGKKAEKNPVALENSPEVRSYPIEKEDITSEIEILTSPDVIKRTIEALRSQKLYPWQNETGISTGDEIYRIKSRIKTEIVPASNVVMVSFLHDDPDEAVHVLNMLMKNYLLKRATVFDPSKAIVFFSNQADKFKRDLDNKDRELMELVESTRMSDPVKEIENNLLIKNDLEQQFNLLKNNEIEKEFAIENLKNALASDSMQLFSFIENLPINNLSSKLQDLLLERGTVLRTYQPESVKVRALDRQVNETCALLKSEVNAFKNNQLKRLQIIRAQMENIDISLDTLNKRNVELQRQIVTSQGILREVQLLESSYLMFAKRSAEAEINSGSDATDLFTFVCILSSAFPSNGPIFPKKRTVIPLGLLVGFITGCALGFLRDYFDQTFKKPSDVQNITGLPMIFSMPKWEEPKA